MTPPTTCIACGASIPPASAVIVGVDIGGYPDRLPTNVVACKGCEDAGRALIRRAQGERERPAS
jgi:hypothetical protein